MRQGNSNKRMRGRGGSGGGNNGGNGNNGGGGRKGPNPLSRSYESTGPDVKIRGTALHIAEKYVTLARDAQSSGDPVLAENYLQHAEHYYRIIAAAQASLPQPVAIVRSDIQIEEDEEDFEEAQQEARFEMRGENRPVIGDDGFISADMPQPFVDDLPVGDRPAEGRGRDDRPRGDRPERLDRNGDRNRGRGFRTGPRGDRPDQPIREPRENREPREAREPRENREPREGARFEGQPRPPRPERPSRGETSRGEAEVEVDLAALPAFLTAAPTRAAAPAPAPAPASPAPVPVAAPVAVAAPVEATAPVVEASEEGADEAPRKRTRGGRGRGRRPEYEAGEGAADAAPSPVPADE